MNNTILRLRITPGNLSWTKNALYQEVIILLQKKYFFYLHCSVPSIYSHTFHFCQNIKDAQGSIPFKSWIFDLYVNTLVHFSSFVREINQLRKPYSHVHKIRTKSTILRKIQNSSAFENRGSHISIWHGRWVRKEKKPLWLQIGDKLLQTKRSTGVGWGFLEVQLRMCFPRAPSVERLWWNKIF